jgi:hypothetical protein
MKQKKRERPVTENRLEQTDLVFALKTTIKLVQMLSNVDKESKVTHSLWILKLMNRLLF